MDCVPPPSLDSRPSSQIALRSLHATMACPTNLEKCMESLIDVFHLYAGEDKDKETLSKKEFKKLVETELPNFMRAQKNPNLVEEMMKDLDVNGDQRLDFQEFLALTNGLCMACDRCYNKMKSAKTKK